MRYLCAWRGCRHTFDDVMPRQWTWLVTWWSARPVGNIDFRTQPVIRDAVLCPEHTQALEAQLKDIGPLG
jgi:hypothetical protein